ncbi:MAG: DUF4215 domain-containing protein [Deltaproteobacteria bacterium]|nr:DUF4215 domain-containing protein [Deltaproteobacteria bacterium]
MNRSLAYFLLLALLGLPVLPGCPSGGTGDDDDSVDDDDDDDDDDGASDPCDSVTDITANLDGTPVTGATTSASGNALTGSCAADSPGAGEVVFSVTPATSGLITATTDNALTDFDTVLYVLTDCSDENTEVVCNDDAAQGNTNSILQWDGDAGTTYYIVVDGYEATGGFELTVDLAVCGDGAVAGDEQCDDNNTDSGDGCAADCTWECVDDSNEDDDDVAGATSLTGATFPTTAAGQVLCPSDFNEEVGVYGDWWAVDVAEGEYVQVDVAGGATLTTTCADQTLSAALLDADLTAFGGGDTTEGECVSFAAEPAAGTYYIAVFWDDQTVAPQDYEVTVDVGTSVCGDDLQTGVEECDDGNTDGDDGCSATCVEEDATCTVVAATETNIDGASLTGDTTTGTDDHAPQACGLAGGAAEDVYSLTVTEDQAIIVDLLNPGTAYDTTLYVRENCVDPGAEIACNDDAGGELSSTLFFDALKDVTYYIFVDGYEAEVGAYEMTLTAPVCGDGNVDINEECDDMNGTPADGCENDCTITPICASAEDEDLGALSSGDNTATVTLVAGADDLPDLDCSSPGGGDYMLRFELTTAGDVTIAYSQTMPTDAQIGVFTDDVDCTVGICNDPVGEPTGSFVVPGLGVGEHFIVLEAWEDGGEGDVALTITAP